MKGTYIGVGIAMTAALTIGGIAAVALGEIAVPWSRCAVDFHREFGFTIAVDREPVLDSPVEVEARATACYKPSQRVEVSLHLPASMRLIEGQMRWEGRMRQGQTVRIRATVIPTEPGDQIIQARAAYPLGEHTDVYARDSAQANVFVGSTDD